jgi:uracil-DNA glycosylase
MSNGNREQVIRRIINMEDRISNCQRCGAETRCVRKPSLGKGDLEPELLMVLESDNQYSRDINRMLELRDLIKTSLGFEKIYHTYLVRCQPKACPLYSNLNCQSNRKLLDKDYHCLLTGTACEGTNIHPGYDSIIACLPFLLEEISILKPTHIVLFGKRISEYVLRAYGFFEEPVVNTSYRYEEHSIIPTVDEAHFTSVECQQIKRCL